MQRTSSSGILSEIVTTKQREVAALRVRERELEQGAFERKQEPRPFAQTLRQRTPAIIAEVKKASPSRGVFRADFHPAKQAREYEKGGAACLSVLTDREYFQGSLADLEAARAAVRVPVLRKDFTIDRLQIFEAAAHGADAILLIAAILDERELIYLRECAHALRLDALVEVHNREELKKAVDCGADLIGVNNRDLDTFEVSLDTSLRLAPLMPAHATRVAESGIVRHADMKALTEAGFHAFLVGEALMKADDAAAALRELLGADGQHG